MKTLWTLMDCGVERTALRRDVMATVCATKGSHMGTRVRRSREPGRKSMLKARS